MIYYIDGLEDYRRDLKIKEITNGCPVERFFSWSPETEDLWQSGSILGKRCVWLQLDRLQADAGMEKALNSKDIWLNDLIVSVKDPDTRLKVYKLLLQNGKHFRCDKLNRQELDKYIRKALGYLGVTMTKEALDLLVMRSCYFEKAEITIYTINIYLKQLSYSTSAITEDTVDAIIPKFLEEDVMKLSAYLFSGRDRDFMNLITDLLDSKQEPLAMLGLVLRYFRIAYKAFLFRELSDEQLCKALGLSRRQMQNVGGVRLLSEKQIKECIIVLQDAAADIKAGKMTGPVAFKIAMGRLVCLVH